MKYVFSVLCIVISCHLVAQEKVKEKLIMVNGTSTLSVSPDLGTLYIRLSHIDSKMTKAVEGLTKKADYYSGLLVNLQFKKEDIKTTGFYVSVNKIYRRDQMIDSGYIATQTLKLDFKNDKETISKILNRFTTSEKETDFSFDFKMSEKGKNEIQNKLIDLAIKDASQKADLIARSSGRKLSSLKTVQYGNSYQPGIMPVMQQNFKMAEGMALDKTYNFTPDDIVFQETVYLEWLFE